MSAIFLIGSAVLFIIMMIILYRSDVDFCRQYKKMVEEKLGISAGWFGVIMVGMFIIGILMFMGTGG